jgi:hypothetical protein
MITSLITFRKLSNTATDAPSAQIDGGFQLSQQSELSEDISSTVDDKKKDKVSLSSSASATKKARR